MEPFDKEFILAKMNEYNLKINESNIINLKIIKTFNNEDIIDGYLYEKKEQNKSPAIDLLEDDKIVMRLNYKEIEGSFQAIKSSKGKVGIVGLGLGYIVQEIAKKDEVDEIIVYEKNPNIIEIYKNNFQNDPKIRIIFGDALKAKRESFEFFFVDIYRYELSLDVVDDYKKFNKIHQIKEYSFWGIEHFLLSCSYEEIIWVYIPENWMIMSKNISGALESSGYIDYYKPLDEKLVSKVLSEFKIILNEDE